MSRHRNPAVGRATFTHPAICAALLILIQLGGLSSEVRAQLSAFRWVAKSGGSGDDYGNGIAVDQAGNSFVVGSFNNSATFGGTNVSSFGGDDLFVTKYDPAGNLLWVRTAGGSTNDTANGVAVDGGGNCYVTGTFWNAANFGTTNLNSSGGRDVFLVKYSGTGNLVWVTHAGGVDDDRGLAIAVDGSSNIFVTGTFNGTAAFDNTNLVSAGVFDIFVAKYDSAGRLLWARQAGGILDDYGTGVATDAAGNCYVTGHFGSPLAVFDTVTLTNRGARDIFVAKYDGAGNLLWVRQGGGSDYDIATALAADSAGNCFVTGHIRGTASFGGTSLTSAGLEDIFVAKYNGAGGLLWATNAGGPGVDYGYGVAVNSVGDCFVTGGFSGTATFGGVTFTGGGIIVLKFGSSGAGLIDWAKQAARDAGEDYGFAIATDLAGNCYLTGYLAGSSTTFDDIIVGGTAGADIYVARLDVLPQVPPLNLRRQGNQIIVFWPTNAAGFTLQYKTDLLPPATWLNLGSPTNTVGGNYEVADDASPAKRYYRLSK
jgi:hypothetical protein